MKTTKGLLTLFVIAGSAVLASAELLYYVEDGSKTLRTVDTSTLNVNVIGGTGTVGDFGDLAWDMGSQTMYYVAGRSDNNLYTVNLGTGAASLVGNHQLNDLFGLTFDGSGALYGSTTDGNFWSLNTANAAASLIGSNSVYPGGLTFNSNTGQVIFLNAGGGSIYSVNTANGSATLLANPGSVNDAGIVYSAVSDSYFAMDWSGNLFQYDSAFNRTLLGTGFGNVASVELAAVPEPATMFVLGLGAVAALRRRKTK